MKGKNIFAFLALMAPLCAEAEIKTDKIYSSHMVLQQGQKIPVSGTCTGKGPVTVSFAGQEVQAKVKNNKWRAELAPMEACAEGKPLTISQGDETLTLDDVVVGEVWLASGQSNMLWRLNQTPDKATLNGPETPLLRFFHSEPQVHTDGKAYTSAQFDALNKGEMYEGEWAADSPSSRPRMSAVGYYFGKNLQQHLDVPVGIIHASLGGSEMVAWMPPAVIRKAYKDCNSAKWMESDYIPKWARGRIKQNIGTDSKAPHPYKPAYLFETGIKPWLHFPIKGVIWYQGETDAEVQDQNQNLKLLTDLIKGWRAEFNNADMHFLMVGLPRINDKAPIRAYWPEFRQVQKKATELLPHTYCVTTIDLGMTNSDVHPPRKVEVGTRMAATAAAEVYGKKDLPFSGPVVSKVEQKGNKLIVHFEHANGLATTDGESPRGFEITSNSKVYKPAEAVIVGDTVELSSPDVKNPTGLRYAWATFLEPNLVNEAKLPAEPYAPSAKNSHKNKTKKK